jgi:hypothetical protein
MTRELETAAAKIRRGTISARSHKLGVDNGEPLILAFEAMLRYARAHQKRYDSPLSNDFVLGPLYLDIIRGLRGLLGGDGAVAMERGITTDSKDNGVLEEMFWHCMDSAGFKEEDM